MKVEKNLVDNDRMDGLGIESTKPWGRMCKLLITWLFEQILSTWANRKNMIKWGYSGQISFGGFLSTLPRYSDFSEIQTINNKFAWFCPKYIYSLGRWQMPYLKKNFFFPLAFSIAWNNKWFHFCSKFISIVKFTKYKLKGLNII